MKCLKLVVLLLLICMSSRGQMAVLSWDVQVDRPVQTPVGIHRGETVQLSPRFVVGTAPVAIVSESLVLRYREPGLGDSQYREIKGAASATQGAIDFLWLPLYDTGSASYEYQVVIGERAIRLSVRV